MEADVLPLHRAFKSSGIPVKIALLLHDGIWSTCPPDRATVARISGVTQKIMENSVRLSVPLKVEVSLSN